MRKQHAILLSLTTLFLVPILYGVLFSAFNPKPDTPRNTFLITSTAYMLRPTWTPSPAQTPKPPARTPKPTWTPSPTRTRKPTSTPRPKPIVIINNNMNVRAGPGTNYSIIGAATLSQQFVITGKNPAGDWWEIDYNRKKGWIYSPLVTAMNAERVPVAAWERARGKAIVVSYDELLRHNEQYVGKLVYLRGDVTQVFEGGMLLRSKEGNKWARSPTWLIYDHSLGRILEEDTLGVIAKVIRLQEYETSGRGLLTVPLLEVIDLRQE